MLSIAFKEWAMICQALATGQQSLILRKGGIAEVDGVFRPDHTRFWLYPTYLHEHRDGIKPAFQSEFEHIHRQRPPSGMVRLEHFAEITQVFQATTWREMETISDLHQWSEKAVHMKFQYRQPGLFVLQVRVFRAAPVEVVETSAYAGCKSWVHLDDSLPIAGAVPILIDSEATARATELQRRLASTPVVDPTK